jgi:DNA-binding transcriptional regulator PaaX
VGMFQIDSLKIDKPKKWDNKWRLVIFDIAQLHSIKRNAFRGKLKELGFRPLQKSVWINPYKCSDEIELLRDFFGLDKKDVRLITAENIEDDNYFKKIFNLE